ncbi:hypothetical protein ACX93W_08275 [Paenibacillus sp. CAU 1782]
MKHEMMLDEHTKLSLANGFGGKVKVFINGILQPYSKQGYQVQVNNQPRHLTITRGAFSGIPKAMLDGHDLQIARPLKAYEWVLSVLPLAIIFLGGFLGALFGALAMVLNIQLFQSKLPVAAKIVLSLLVGAAACVAYIFFASVILIMLGQV